MHAEFEIRKTRTHGHNWVWLQLALWPLSHHRKRANEFSQRAVLAIAYSGPGLCLCQGWLMPFRRLVVDAGFIVASWESRHAQSDADIRDCGEKSGRQGPTCSPYPGSDCGADYFLIGQGAPLQNGGKKEKGAASFARLAPYSMCEEAVVWI
jgi:hypothetical protein